MLPEEFRRMALRMPEAIESAHMSHPDFRVEGKIFASLGYPDDRFGMVTLPEEDQAAFLRANPKAFSPAKGAWGRRGSTLVSLKNIKGPELRKAMVIAWKKRAPKRLHDTSDL